MGIRIQFYWIYRVFGNSVQYTFSGLLPEPRYRRGVGLPPEKVGVHVGVTICKKSPAKAAVVITAGKCQEVVALRHVVLVVTDFATLFGGVRVSFLLGKKFAK
jgi:hypothetical protein